MAPDLDETWAEKLSALHEDGELLVDTRLTAVLAAETIRDSEAVKGE